MKIDPYAPCPCGSGKKIKFCCGDLANDIERVVRMVEGDQRLAALQLLNQLLKKHPHRVALLDMKAGIAQSMGQHDEARVAIDRILDAQPDNVNALARRAIALGMDGQAREAAATLQEATSIDEEEVPPSVHEAFLHVGRALLEAGHILAAMAHFDVHFRAQPDDVEDVRGAKMLLQLNHSGGLPLLVRDDLDLLPCPGDVAWAPDFENASVSASHAAWRRAAEQFERLLDASDHAPSVVYNLAVVRGWLGETRAMVAGLREFARRDVPEDDAVESLALANLLDHGHEEDLVARVEQTYEVPDQDHLLAVLAGDRRLRSVPSPEASDDDDSPPPLAHYSLLDRPMPTGADDLAYEDVPVVLGLVTLFGRETDRPPRVVLMTVKNADFEATQRQFDTVTESARGSLVGEEDLGSIDRVYDAMVPRWCLPDGVPGDRQLELAAEQRRRAIAEIWPTVPQHALGGLSPDAAARDPERRIQLLAAVLVVATTSLAGNETAAVAALRARLGVGEPAPIDLTACDRDVWERSIVRVLRLDLEKLEDDDIAQLWRRAKFLAADQILVHLAGEAVRRPSLRAEIGPFEAYDRLVQAAADVEAAQQIIAEARQATAGEENADVSWDLLEFGFYLEMADSEGVSRMLDHFRAEHENDPLVNQALYEMFASRGIRLEEMPKSPGEAAMAEVPPEQSSEIWTPESKPRAEPGADRPVIWTP